MYKFVNSKLHVFIVHPGGPFWKDKDEGAWSIPKGEVNNEEPLLETAKREFKEETGIDAPREESKIHFFRKYNSKIRKNSSCMGI